MICTFTPAQCESIAEMGQTMAERTGRRVTSADVVATALALQKVLLRETGDGRVVAIVENDKIVLKVSQFK